MPIGKKVFKNLNIQIFVPGLMFMYQSALKCFLCLFLVTNVFATSSLLLLLWYLFYETLKLTNTC